MKTKQTRLKRQNIIVLGTILLVLLFLVQNTQVSRINFLFWNVSMPKIILMAMFLVIGLVTGVYLVGDKKI